ncbi:MAG: hypothetical protein IK019_03100 [Clostridia bacterium]|nr:hypothetical protein [Clostridia bacterium]
MKRSLKEWLVRLAILAAGLAVAHFGVTLFLLTDLGSDPFNVLIQGLYRTLERLTGLAFLTHGRVHAAVSLLIIAALLAADKSYVKAGTLVCMVCGGPIIDVFTALLSPLALDQASLWIRVPVLALGCVILACGMTAVIKSDAGTGPNDLVAVVLSDKTGIRFAVMRVIADACFVAAGWAMGGTFGTGTVICALLVGPVAGVFLPLNGKLVNRIVAAAMKDR